MTTIEGERDFIKTMPYDTTNDNVYPDFMLLDTGLKPTPLAIFHAFASEDTLDARHKAKTRWEAEYNTSWIWNIEHHDKTYPKIPFKQEK